MAEAYIVEALRTAGGRRNGRLSSWHPADLLARVLDALVQRTAVDPGAIDDVIVGCVSQIGEQSFHIGRSAVLASSLPETVPAVTIDRQCGSSQQSLHFAAQAVLSGTQDLVIAAGVESMSRVPIGSPTRLATDAGMGGPWSAQILQRYGVEAFSQFTGAEMLAHKYALDRDQLDAYSLLSHRRAIAAVEAQSFAREILPIADDQGEHKVDEGIRFDASLEAIAGVRSFLPDGRLSAASSSQICDGAAGLLVASERALRQHNLTPLAKVRQLTVCGGDPVIMLETPITATEQALARAGLHIDDIDLFEVNEAFAPIPLAWLKGTKADPARLNVNGGAIALGHPLGGSGTKLMTTLLHALETRGKRYGLQTMCEGGGLANVTIVERL